MSTESTPHSPPVASNDPFGLSRFSIRRYSVQSTFIQVVLMAVLCALTVETLSSGSTLQLALSALAVALFLSLMSLLLYIGIRSVAIEVWTRRLGMGDLDFRIDMPGHDEISKVGQALETLRQNCIRAMQLDMVRKLSEQLREKNATLESTLHELQRTQDQAISQQKLAELGVVSAGVAHEIRNPLQFIKNFAESSAMLTEQLAEIVREKENLTRPDSQEDIAELTTDLRENMARITNHSDRANLIVSGMLSLSRDNEQNFRPVNINKLLLEQTMLVVRTARTQYSGFDVNIQHELAPDVGEINAVPEDLARVFINLVNNACQAIEEKSQQGHTFTPTLRLKTRKMEHTVMISIWDNGAGMAPDVIAKMFTPFFTTKGTEGIGLGMSLSHDIVRAHGGAITPQSEIGEFSELTVTIPLQLPECGA